MYELQMIRETFSTKIWKPEEEKQTQQWRTFKEDIIKVKTSKTQTKRKDNNSFSPQKV